DQRQCLDVYDRHFLVPIGIALSKGTAVAETGVIDQEIDFEIVAIKGFEESPQLSKISEIDFANVNNKFRVLSFQSVSQLDQLFITPCDQNHRTGTTGELARKFAPDPGRSTGNEGITIVEFH